MKLYHEIRDPLHAFVRLDSDERKVLDSRPVQRLRDVTQLALTHLVYPGATHKRFEHSLGVMELASRVFDVITKPDHIHPQVRELFPEVSHDDKLVYWRRALRMAALCHDIGHLPFSHAAERELFPGDWNHERMTAELILSEEMLALWNKVTPTLRAEDVVKLAVPKEAMRRGLTLNDWESILSEVIASDSFGVDRIDYLLRDSHHAGVAYGRFDHYRLIDTLRILPPPPTQPDEEQSSLEPTLGVEHGGIQSAEGLLLARAFMFSQVYWHAVRLIYDVHLQEFLAKWLPQGRFPTEVSEYLAIADSTVLSACAEAAQDPSSDVYSEAVRLSSRDHFKVVYSRSAEDVARNVEAANLVSDSLVEEFGDESVRFVRRATDEGIFEFPVLLHDGRVASSTSMSDLLRSLPAMTAELVYVHPSKCDEARQFVDTNRERIIPEGEVSDESIA